MQIGDRLYRLEDFSPSAHLPEAWAEAWIAGVVEAKIDIITLVENEYPFLAYIEEAGGSSALRARREMVVYTGGFPTPKLSAALGQIALRRPDFDSVTGGTQMLAGFGSGGTCAALWIMNWSSSGRPQNGWYNTKSVRND